MTGAKDKNQKEVESIDSLNRSHQMRDHSGQKGFRHNYSIKVAYSNEEGRKERDNKKISDRWKGRVYRNNRAAEKKHQGSWLN